MAQKLYEEANIQAIADAIRKKNGLTDTYKTSEMAAAISAIESGGGDIPEEALIIEHDCTRKFTNGNWDWFVNTYGDRITTNRISCASYMFYQTALTDIPFDLNFFDTATAKADYMFQYCGDLKQIGDIYGLYPSDIRCMFSDCFMLRNLPNFVNLNTEYLNANKTYIGTLFSNCYSLRSVPEDLLKRLYSQNTASVSITSTFTRCYALDEIRGLSPQTGVLTTSQFGSSYSGAFLRCNRVKNIIFDVQNDGTPYIASWKSQTIDLSTYVGYTDYSKYILDYNSGITADKEVTDDASYQALKDNADWFTRNVAYSRYNHASAVATINSLPDTSAYLATQTGGTNTIKFNGASGSATDGGAINTLTEQEIAIAAAKGWTVSLV